MADNLVIEIDTSEAQAALDALKESFAATAEAASSFASQGTDALDRFAAAMDNLKGIDPSIGATFQSLNTALASINVDSVRQLTEQLNNLGAGTAAQAATDIEAVAQATQQIKPDTGITDFGNQVEKAGRAARGAATDMTHLSEGTMSAQTAMRTLVRELANAEGFMGGISVRLGSMFVAFQSLTNQGASAVGIFQSLASSMGATTVVTGILAIGLLAVNEAISKIKEAIEPVIKIHESFDQLQNSVEAATGSVKAGAQAIAFVENLAQQTGAAIGPMAKDFSDLSLAAAASGVSMDKTQEVFSSLTKAFTAFGTSAEKQQAIMMATERIFESNTVQGRELSTIFARDLPGALNIWAAAEGVSVERLKAMAQAGELSRASFIRFTKALADNETVQELFAKQSENVSAAAGRVGVAWERTLNAFAGSDRSFISFVSQLRDGLDTLSAQMSAPGFRAFAQLMGEIAGVIANVLLTALAMVAGAFNLLGTAIAFAATPIGELTIAIATLVLASNPITDLVAAFLILKAAIDATGGSFSSLGEDTNKAKSGMEDVSGASAEVTAGLAALARTAKNDLADALADVNDNLLDMKKRASETKNEISNLNDAIHDIDKAVKDSNGAMKDAESANKKYQDSIKGQNDALEQQKAGLERQKRDMELNLKSMQDSMRGLDSLTGKTKGAGGANKEFSDSVDFTKNATDGFQRSINALNDQIADNRRAMEAASRDLQDRKDREEQYTQSLREQADAERERAEALKKYGGELTQTGKNESDQLTQLGVARDDANKTAAAMDILTNRQGSYTDALQKNIDTGLEHLNTNKDMIAQLQEERQKLDDLSKAEPQNAKALQQRREQVDQMIKSLGGESSQIARSIAQSASLKAAYTGEGDAAKVLSQWINELTKDYGAAPTAATKVEDAATRVGEAFTKLGNDTGITLENIQKVASWVWEHILDGLAKSITDIDDLWNNLVTTIQTAWEKAKAIFDFWINIGQQIVDAFNKMKDDLAQIWDNIVAKVSAAWDKIKGFVKSLFGAGNAADNSGGGSQPSTDANAQRLGTPNTSQALESQRTPISAFNNAPRLAEGVENSSKFPSVLPGGGIPTVIHPNEAVIPLSRGRTVPVDIKMDTALQRPEQDMAPVVKGFDQMTSAVTNLNDSIQALHSGIMGFGEIQKSFLTNPPALKVDNSGVQVINQLPPTPEVLSPTQARFEPPVTRTDSTTPTKTRSIVVQMTVNTPDVDSFKKSGDQIARDQARKIQRAINRLG